MRTFFSRVWGMRIGWLDVDPVQHLGDPDETPEPSSAPEGSAGASTPVVERLDVAPERRPWDGETQIGRAHV